MNRETIAVLWTLGIGNLPLFGFALTVFFEDPLYKIMGFAILTAGELALFLILRALMGEK